MNDDLVSSREYGDLSEDPEQCFIEFEAIARRNMNEMLEKAQDGTYGNYNSLSASLEKQYMAEVYPVAQECGITSLPSPDFGEDGSPSNYNRFLLAVQGEVARIRVRGRGSRNSLSVQLTDQTRTIIKHYVSRLRDVVDRSDLPAERKTVLHDKLNELVEELENRRSGFGKILAVGAVVLYGLAAAANATTILAEGNAAFANIVKLIGKDKETEEAARLRLIPPSKALPAPEKRASSEQGGPIWEPPVSDLDEEIPF